MCKIIYATIQKIVVGLSKKPILLTKTAFIWSKNTVKLVKLWNIITV